MVENKTNSMAAEGTELHFDLVVKRENFAKRDTGELIWYTSFSFEIEGERFTLQPKADDKRYLNRLLRDAGLNFENSAEGKIDALDERDLVRQLKKLGILKDESVNEPVQESKPAEKKGKTVTDGVEMPF